MKLVDTRRARLLAAVAARGTTAAKIATGLGGDRSLVTRWCRGTPWEGVITTGSLARVLRVPVECLEPGGPWGPLVGLPAEKDGHHGT